MGTTIIRYEEQMRGWLSKIARASTAQHQVRAYARLKRELRTYCEIPVIEYDANAIGVFEHLNSIVGARS
jgi:tRNA(fMet)-specific endonuclease VapC